MGSRRKQKTEKSMIQNLYWKQVFRSPKTKIGLMVVIIFALAAIFAPVLAPHDPLLVDVSIKLKNPSAAYPLGTDQLGRCILSRLLWGSRYSLSYSFTVLLITVCVGACTPRPIKEKPAIDRMIEPISIVASAITDGRIFLNTCLNMILAWPQPPAFSAVI